MGNSDILLQVALLPQASCHNVREKKIGYHDFHKSRGKNDFYAAENNNVAKCGLRPAFPLSEFRDFSKFEVSIAASYWALLPVPAITDTLVSSFGVT